MKSYLIYFFLFFITLYSAQSEKKSRNYIYESEKFIIQKKKDSAAFFLRKAPKNNYSLILKKINENQKVTYKEYDTFLNRISNRQTIKYKLISDFISNNVKEPNNKNKINTYFVNIKWVQVNKLRDEIGLEAANRVQKKLETYVNKFDNKEIDVIKAKTKITTHPIVMYYIKQDFKGKELCLKSIETARKLKDIELEVTFLYYLTDFLIIEGKLKEYIDISENCLELIKKLGKETPFYYATIEHLIDAYIYKGGEESRVLELLETLYNEPDLKIHSYNYYAKFLTKIDKNSLQKKKILNKFNVSNTLELVEKFRVLGKDLNRHDYQKLIGSSAKALIKHGFYQKGDYYKDSQIQLIKNIYSKDLSETLANYKTEQAVKEKEIEIINQKQKVKNYIIIACLIGLVLIMSLITLKKIRKQSKELSSKNKIIRQTLNEKELLIKEVHHRVKNNFQIVSSLLELQSKNIENKKALKLANENKNRIKSMALIHQKLYQNKSGLIDFDEYIQLLVKDLTSMYDSKNKVKTNIDSKNMMFDVDTAIPLGLIINEIITNSYKYAFNDTKENQLKISINKNSKEDFKLIIEDNGPGIPETIELKKVKSLGLRLINRLVKQLHGSIKLSSVDGTRFEITFKDFASRKMID